MHFKRLVVNNFWPIDFTLYCQCSDRNRLKFEFWKKKNHCHSVCFNFIELRDWMIPINLTHLPYIHHEQNSHVTTHVSLNLIHKLSPSSLFIQQQLKIPRNFCFFYLLWTCRVDCFTTFYQNIFNFTLEHVIHRNNVLNRSLSFFTVMFCILIDMHFVSTFCDRIERWWKNWKSWKHLTIICWSAWINWRMPKAHYSKNYDKTQVGIKSSLNKQWQSDQFMHHETNSSRSRNNNSNIKHTK